MFKSNDELAFYGLSGLAIVLGAWMLGLFGIRESPLGVPLLLLAFCLNPLLVFLGKGFTSEEDAVAVAAGCGALAFVAAWFANTAASSTLALPAAVMFILPSAVYHFRKRSGPDVLAP